MFKSGGWATKPNAGFISHYNAKLGRCFIQISETDVTKTSVSISKPVFDAFEGKTYGDYLWFNYLPDKKSAFEIAPQVCKITLLSGEEKACQSEAEYNASMKAYLE